MGNLCYLLLPDGSKIEFLATPSSYIEDSDSPPTTYYSYTFKTQAIIDPYGLRTTLTHDGNGRLTQITEPAGRWIKLFYTPGGEVDYIQGSDGRAVDYTYESKTFSSGTFAWTVLTSVRYFNDPALDATYSYEKPNVGSDNGAPLLKTCNDTMYVGPMKKIAYVYATATNPDGTAPVYGQILSENYFSGTTVGTAVSTPQRSFTYAENGLLQSSTDFKGVSASQTYDANLYLNSSTDRRGNRTDFIRDPLTGNVTQTTFPLTPSDSGMRSTAQTVYGSANCPDPNNRDGNNPYYPYSVTNERGYPTTFLRDANKRVIKINYPDGAYETFVYEGSNGRLLSRTPPATPSDPNPGAHPTQYGYDENDRVSTITDPRGKRTWFAYNQRGQVTKLTHEDGAYIQNGYNADGTVAWTADENHPGAATNANQRTRYAYDDYKRVETVINPLNQTTSYYYGRNWNDPYLHTTSNLKAVYSPMWKTVHINYDENWRRALTREPTPEVDAWSYFAYDAEGNLTWTQDARGNVTTTEYDERGRRTAVFAPLGQTTRWEYDRAGNLTKEIRPDGLFRRLEFEQMNRVMQTYGFANEGTGYGYDLAGNQIRLTDAKGASYTWDYDALNRKSTATYPTDIASVNRTETWHYDIAGNMDQYKNPAGQVKSIVYDNRNRPTTSYWDGVANSWVAMEYDAASRTRSIATYNSAGWETVVAFGYDDANRQISETQSLAGVPDRVVTTPRDADGLRTQLNVVGAYAIGYDYTGRGQLKTIYDGAGASEPWFRYTYDLNGNMTKRQNVRGGVNDSTNVSYDALNRPFVWESTGQVDAPFARSWMNYDSLNRVTASWRDENGKGDTFGYSADGQLISAKYNADQVRTGNPINPTRIVSYNTDVLNRTGANGVNENGMTTAFTANPMNQYTWVGAQPPNYTANFSLFQIGGFEYNYDPENRLTSVTNRAQFVYDGLGRCVKRTIDGVTTLFTYDGWKPILEWNASGGFAASNIYGAGADEILTRNDASLGLMRYKSDRQGNIMFLLDDAGNGLEKYTYDAFGWPTVVDWNNSTASWDEAHPRSRSNYGNRFMFTGREFFVELGIYDYRNRMYQPQLGRFLQPDPIGFGGGDPNLFRYCGGDPVNRVDPSGLLDIWGFIKKLFEGGDQTATTETIVVTGTPIGPETAETAGHGYRGPAGPNDFSPNNRGDGPSGDGNGGGGGGGSGGKEKEKDSSSVTPCSDASATPVTMDVNFNLGIVTFGSMATTSGAFYPYVGLATPGVSGSVFFTRGAPITGWNTEATYGAPFGGGGSRGVADGDPSIGFGGIGEGPSFTQIGVSSPTLGVSRYYVFGPYRQAGNAGQTGAASSPCK